jgi:DNA-directed RNA polymerase specialized sigma24 family protein
VTRRRKFLNEISEENLRRFDLLIRSARDADVPIPTKRLICTATLENDPHGARGALKMAEVLGLVHRFRGRRKAFCWRGGPRGQGDQPDQSLPSLLPFQRVRDLLQYYRGSLIGTLDLARDSGITNRREALGGLKLLHLCGLVEIGKLDVQTVAWRWIAGRGQSRTYQRGHFARVEQSLSLDERTMAGDGRVRWEWLEELVYREWLNQEQAEGSEGLTETDGLRRYRPPTLAGQALLTLIGETIEAMPSRQGRLMRATLLRGHSLSEAARLLQIPVSTAGRLSESGLADLRRVLLQEGFGPPTAPGLLAAPEHVARAA